MSAVTHDTEAKRFATLQARFAQAGHALRQSGPGDGPGPVSYLAERWGLARYLPTLAEAEKLLIQVGALAMNSAVDEFRQAITAACMEAPDVIHDDGAIHHFSPGGRSNVKPAWHMLHTDGILTGAFGDWRSSLTSTWCDSCNARKSGRVDAKAMV